MMKFILLNFIPS